MPTVAEQLVAAREQKQMTIQQVASITNIKSEHVRALEKGDYDVFSAPIYIRGFVKSIARALKMDTPEVMRQLAEELAATERFREDPSLTLGPKSPLDHVMFALSKVRWRWVLPLLLIGIIIWIGYAMFGSNEPKNPALDNIQIGPGLYNSDEGAPGETLPLPSDEE